MSDSDLCSCEHLSQHEKGLVENVLSNLHLFIYIFAGKKMPSFLKKKMLSSEFSNIRTERLGDSALCGRDQEVGRKKF